MNKIMKRFGNCYPNNVKRIKMQQDMDDIWGEDPDCDEVDKCINLATQLCSEIPAPNHLNTVNETLNFTTYDDFKKQNKMSSSTQLLFPPPIASTSAFSKQISCNIQSNNSLTTVTTNSIDNDIPKLLQKIKSLENEKKKLSEISATKDGEISILRSQLKDVKKAVDNEKMDKMKTVQENQQKFDNKFTTVIKELNSFKCELELKNLEIANLREKVVELKKVCNSTLNQSILQEELHTSQIFCKKEKKYNSQHIQTEMCNALFPITQITHYPLEILIPKSVFQKSSERNSALKLSNNKNILSSYTNNFSILLGNNNQATMNPQNCNTVSLNNFYPHIQKLIFCSIEELNNSNIVLQFIDTILTTTKTSLTKLLSQLNEIYSQLTFEDVEKIDNLYLQENMIEYKTDCIFSGELWHENESGVEIRRYVAILSSLVCVCEKLRTYFCTEYVKNEMDVDGLIQYEFLNILLQIVTVIKNSRWSEQFCGLLSAILKLLGNLSSSETLPTACCNIMFKIFQEVIYSRPSKSVLKYVTEFLKHISRYEIFISKLCFMQNCEGTQFSIKNGLLLITEVTCAFRILSTELETSDLDSEMMVNTLQFLINSLSCNVLWMYNQEEKRCDCLSTIFDFGVDILCKTVLKHENNGKDTTIHHTIFRIGLVFLEIITAKIPYTLQKFSTSVAQFQTIIRYISTIKNKLCLQKHHENALYNLESILSNEAQQHNHNKNTDYVLNKCFI